MDLSAERPHESKAARRGGKDPDDPRAPLDLLSEALEHIRRLEMRAGLARQAVEVQGLADMRVDPVGELRRLLPAREPRRQVLLGFFESAPVIEPAQLLAAVSVGLPQPSARALRMRLA